MHFTCDVICESIKALVSLLLGIFVYPWHNLPNSYEEMEYIGIDSMLSLIKEKNLTKYLPHKFPLQQFCYQPHISFFGMVLAIFNPFFSKHNWCGTLYWHWFILVHVRFSSKVSLYSVNYSIGSSTV